MGFGFSQKRDRNHLMRSGFSRGLRALQVDSGVIRSAQEDAGEGDARPLTEFGGGGCRARLPAQLQPHVETVEQ